MRRTEYMICEMYPQITPFLAHDVHFIHAEDLLQMYPDKTAKERENLITERYGAVFIIGIGCKLSNGQPHDLRAPDYDDYTTIDPKTGLPGLNGDLMVWNSVLGRAFEISSMGIRVDKGSNAEAAGTGRKRRTHQAVFPPTPAGRNAASHNRRRYRTVTPLHALSQKRTYRRNPGKHMAGRYAQGM